jgi:Helix-turn-helix domain
MSALKTKLARRRRYPINLIKGTWLYDTNEIAKLFGLHRNTVRQWLKEGLRPIDLRRPILVYGSDLKAFLAQRQKQRRQKCAPGEFFCFRCRAPRRAWGNLVEAAPYTQKISKLTAICCLCETEMHRTIGCANLPNFIAAVERKSVASERLSGSSDPIENCDFERAKLDVETEPAE